MLEFALIAPIMVVLAVALGDFGRVFSAGIALESSAREAADYGAFLGSDAWAESLSPWTANDQDMRQRACTAMSGTWDFDNSSGDCSGNPAVTWQLVKPAGVSDCSGRTGLVEPCKVHVTVTYVFHPIINLPPFPSSLTLTRDSWFAISDLPSS
jgi:Flp pilus assembly protein TadG